MITEELPCMSFLFQNCHMPKIYAFFLRSQEQQLSSETVLCSDLILRYEAETIQLLLLFAMISDYTRVQSISPHPTEIKALGIKKLAVQS